MHLPPLSPLPNLHQNLTVDEARELIDHYRPPPPPPPPPNLLEWSYQHRAIDGVPFSLDRYPSLIPVYEDESPFICLIKPNQAGGSEWLLNTSLHALDAGAAYFGLEAKKSLNVGYIFPKWTQLRDFSKDRIRKIAGETPYLTELLSPMRVGPLRRESDLGLYFIRNGAWYLRGAHNPDEQLASFPVDLLIIDEYDLLTGRAITLAEKRLRASPLRWKRYISKPYLPRQGIHGLYLESDQRQWELQCPACEDWQPPDFWANVARVIKPGKTEYFADWSKLPKEALHRSEYAFVCRHCGQPIDRSGPGRWRVLSPGAPIRGYAIPGLVAPYVPLIDVVEGSLAEEPDILLEWYRADLGLAKAPEGGQLSRDDLEGCKADYKMTRRSRRCTMGVDVGVKLHVRIGRYQDGLWHALWIGEVDEADDLDELMERYDVRAAVIDSQPESRMARDFCLRWPGRAWMADYLPPTTVAKEVFNWRDPDWEDSSTEAGQVKIARTEAMDRVANSHRERMERLPANADTIPSFYAQMCSPVRVETKRKKADGTQYDVIVYLQSGPDHYYHASVYERAARDKLPPPSIPTSAVTGDSAFA